MEEGTRESPIALYSDVDDDKAASAAGVKRKLESHVVTAHASELANGGSKKKRKTVEIVSNFPASIILPFSDDGDSIPSIRN